MSWKVILTHLAAVAVEWACADRILGNRDSKPGFKASIAGLCEVWRAEPKEMLEWFKALPQEMRRKFDEAQWALERIQSPHFRGEGEKWIFAAKAQAQ